MSSFAAVRKQRTKHLAQPKGDAGIAGRKQALSLAKQTLHYIGGRMLAARPLCFCLQISSSTRETTINYLLLRAERDSAPRLSAILKTEHIDIVIFMYRLSMVALQLVLLSSSTHALMLDNLPHHRDPSAAEDFRSRKYSHQSFRRCG
jgi:hypothetical protein